MPPFATADATYPPNVRRELDKRDFIDPIWAAHFNIQQNELRATEKTLGVWPQVAEADPADRKPNYVTVANRINKTARAEQMISYVAANTSAEIPPGSWQRVAFGTPIADSHDAGYVSGLTIPQTGYWVVTAKADWTADDLSRSKGALRVISIEINGSDVGLRRSLKEDEFTASTPTTKLVWQEALAKGTNISVAVCTDVPGAAASHRYPVNVYLRAHLVRCLGRAALNLTTAFEYVPDPDPPPPPKPQPGPVVPRSPAPSQSRSPELQIKLVNPDRTIYEPDLQGGYYSERALDVFHGTNNELVEHRYL